MSADNPAIQRSPAVNLE